MINLDVQKFIRDPKNRDSYAKTFLFEHILFNTMSRELFELISEVVMGTEEIVKGMDCHLNNVENELADQYVRDKRLYLTQIFFRYSRIFDLCRVLGITNVYDIGCQWLNQAFLLIRYSNLHYIGIDKSNFYLNDYRIVDRDVKNFYFPITNQVPPAFCGGRISFMKACYPFELNVSPNNIAVACSSIAELSDKKDINQMVAALTKDFERVIFNVSKNTIHFWKDADWKDLKLYPIGHNNFIFGTKYFTDVERLKIIYPFSNGRFSTGICNFYEYNSPGKPEDADDCDFLECISDWNC